MKRCILHIGHAKTATTYLQHCLHLNEPVFHSHGYWLPSHFIPHGFYDLLEMSREGHAISGNLAPAHILLSEGQAARLPDMYAYLFAAPEMPPDADVLLSSELFFYYPSATAAVARAAIAHGYTPEVLAYVPRQDRACITAYLQNVRNHGFVDGVVDFLVHDERMGYCRYLRAMDRLSRAVPGLNITLRTFDRAYLTGGDVFTDFLAATGCTVPEHACRRPPQVSNEGLCLEHYELLRAATLLHRPDAVERLRAAATRLTSTERDRVHSHYYRSYVRDFLARDFIPANAELVARFMPHATADECAYWQQLDPVVPPLERDHAAFDRLHQEAFRSTPP